jgi:ferredoxin-type protein NapH
MFENKIWGIGKIELLRILTAALVIVFFAVAPIFGLVYGTTCALNLGNFVLMSPLELILLMLSTKTFLLTWLVSGVTVIVVIMVFGRFFCGWVCPVGALLEYSHIITEKNHRKTVGVLNKNWEKYAVLFAVLSAALLFDFSAPYLFSPPSSVYRALFEIVSRGIVAVDLTVILLFFVIDLLAVHYGRSWCNTICPLGTVISGFSLINLFKPKVDQKKCIDFDFNCLNCERVCPMRIPVTRANRWTMMECNKCLKCWDQCPVDAIKMELFG